MEFYRCIMKHSIICTNFGDYFSASLPQKEPVPALLRIHCLSWGNTTKRPCAEWFSQDLNFSFQIWAFSIFKLRRMSKYNPEISMWSGELKACALVCLYRGTNHFSSYCKQKVLTFQVLKPWLRSRGSSGLCSALLAPSSFPKMAEVQE